MNFNIPDLVERYALGFVSYLAAFFDPSGAEDVLTLERDGRLATYSLLGALLSIWSYHVIMMHALPGAGAFWSLVAALIGSWVFQITILHLASRCSGGRPRIIDSTAAGLRVFPIAASFAALVGAVGYHGIDWMLDDPKASMTYGFVCAAITYAVLIICYLPCAMNKVSSAGKFSRIFASSVVSVVSLVVGMVIALTVGDL